MTFKTLIAASGSLAAVMAVAPAAAQTYTEAWRATGFSAPESVSFDPGTNSLFVSNVNSPDMSANGQGYVSQVGLDGTVMTEKFVDGLNAPKGTYVVDGTLYVAGVNELVEIDIATAAVTNRYAAENAPFLNDVVAAPDGRVFVTESAGGSIYVLENGTFSVWLTDPLLAGANGIEIDGDTLLIAPLGDISQGFGPNMPPQRIKTVDLVTKAIADYGTSDPIGVLDGLEITDNGLLVSDNPAGTVLRVATDGSTETVLTPGTSAADIEYLPDTDTILVPLMGSGEVVAYRAQ